MARKRGVAVADWWAERFRLNSWQLLSNEQLRLRYPDEAFDRFLRSERDREAEERKAEAMERLIGTLAKAVLDDLSRGQSLWAAMDVAEPCKVT